MYLNHAICSVHWDALTADDQPAGALAKALGIPVAETATSEDPMTETTQNTTPTETKTKKAKAPKNSAMTVAAPKTKTAKASKPEKPKRERKPKEENLMVFAFRLSKPQSAAFHKAAGPANASRTMRALAVAFTQESEAAFKSIVEEARKLR
jgi:hypothetical protein